MPHFIGHGVVSIPQEELGDFDGLVSEDVIAAVCGLNQHRVIYPHRDYDRVSAPQQRAVVSGLDHLDCLIGGIVGRIHAELIQFGRQVQVVDLQD